ncbi:MAG: lysophospholipid acyltransferase family protein [Leptolyngbya sp.]|nr:lysophospholipid acyltransferase family protein [Leptolyngbya sp.]
MARSSPMASPDSPDVPVAPAAPAPQSHCSPWLTPLAYGLGQYLVLPLYFGPIIITGQVHLIHRGPVILAPTHRARWDSIVLPLAAGRPATGRDLRFMVTDDEVKGLQGWFIRRLGGFPVNVRRPTVSSLRHGIDLLRNQEMLVIYPEGGIRRDDHVHPLKPGLARLAVQAEGTQPGLNVHILPVDIYYGAAYPRWRCPVQIHIGAPLAVSTYLQEDNTPEALKTAAQRITADLQLRLTTLVEARQSRLAGAKE